MINIQKEKKLRIHSTSLSLSLWKKWEHLHELSHSETSKTSDYLWYFHNFSSSLCSAEYSASVLLWFYLDILFVWAFFCSHVDICGVFVREKCVFFFLSASCIHAAGAYLPHPLQHIHPLSVVTLHVFLLFKDFTGWTNFLLGNQDKLG